MKPIKSWKIAALSLCAMTAHADEVLLKNGDKITGTVLNKSGDVLEIKTNYADKIIIKWDAVETLSSDQPLAVILKDKQELKGLAGASKDGAITLKNEGVFQTQPIPLANISDINKAPPKFFSGNANFGGAITGGNTDRQSYHMDAGVVFDMVTDRVAVGGQYNYADDSKKLSARNFQLFGTYAHYFTDKWYGYTNGLFTNDRFQDIELRSAFGVGAGYQIFKSPDLNLAVEAGPTYVNTNFYDYSYGNPTQKLQDRSGIAGRWAVNYDQYVLNHTVQLFHNNEGLINEDLFIRTRTGFRVPVWKGVNFTNEIQADYFDHPAPGKQSLDTRYLFSLGYGW
ncbi:MAG: DUF481 domain-containing protein [Methylophilaceae bacterium]|nr:DUF481 domain-containing protein [Methylophilaceae bacterium]